MLQISPTDPLHLTCLTLQNHPCQSWSLPLITHALCSHKQCWRAPHPPQSFFWALSPPPSFWAGLRERTKSRATIAKHTLRDPVSRLQGNCRHFSCWQRRATWSTVSSPAPPPHTEGEFPSIKGDHVWISITSKTHSPSASVKGSHGLLNYSHESFPLQVQIIQRSKIHLESW